MANIDPGKTAIEIRKPRMGFEAPAVSGEVLQERDGEWEQIVVAEERPGFVVKDRRIIR